MTFGAWENDLCVDLPLAALATGSIVTAVAMPAMLMIEGRGGPLHPRY